MSRFDERVKARNGEVGRSHEDDAHRGAYGEMKGTCLPQHYRIASSLRSPQ
jgi:hypothetical protein